MWLSIQNRLKTTGKLYRFGVSNDNRCCICDQGEETHAHLFYDCHYSKQILQAFLSWISIVPRRPSLIQWIIWTYRSCKGSKIRKQVLCAVIATATYQIWRVRNEAYKVQNVNKCIDHIKFIVKHIILFCIPKNCSSVDRRWIEQL